MTSNLRPSAARTRRFGALALAGALALGMGACNKDNNGGGMGGIGGGGNGGNGGAVVQGGGDNAKYCDSLKKVESTMQGTSDPQEMFMKASSYIPDVIASAPASDKQDWSRLVQVLSQGLSGGHVDRSEMSQLSSKMYNRAKDECGVDLAGLKDVGGTSSGDQSGAPGISLR